MTVDINKLNELYEKANSYGEPVFSEETKVADEIYGAWPSLYKELMAGRKLRDGMNDADDTYDLDSAIAEYDNALKE